MRVGNEKKKNPPFDVTEVVLWVFFVVVVVSYRGGPVFEDRDRIPLGGESRKKPLE